MLKEVINDNRAQPHPIADRIHPEQAAQRSRSSRDVIMQREGREDDYDSAAEERASRRQQTAPSASRQALAQDP